MKYLIALAIGLSLCGCRDFKMVLGDDSSDESSSSEYNTDSKNDNSNKTGSNP